MKKSIPRKFSMNVNLKLLKRIMVIPLWHRVQVSSIHIQVVLSVQKAFSRQDTVLLVLTKKFSMVNYIFCLPVSEFLDGTYSRLTLVSVLTGAMWAPELQLQTNAYKAPCYWMSLCPDTGLVRWHWTSLVRQQFLSMIQEVYWTDVKLAPEIFPKKAKTNWG